MNNHSLDDRINALVDDELSVSEHEDLLRLADEDPVVAAEIARAQALRGSLRRLGDCEAPPDLAPTVLDLARRASLRESRPSMARTRHLVQGAVATAMIVLALMLVMPADVPPEDVAYDEQDVAQALEDVQLAFAIVSRMGERTGRIVREEAIGGRTIEPVTSALRSVVGPTEPPQ